jgi:hypothetical protein
VEAIMKNIYLACAVLACLTLGAAAALADSPFNANASLRDNLNALATAKKPVVVVLKNGETYRAALGAVGEHYAVLTKPQGKEFFDVLVAIDEIAAVEARVAP